MTHLSVSDTGRSAGHGPRPDPLRSSGPSIKPPTSWLRFARHYVVMVLAMYAGMLVLDPLYGGLAHRAGYTDPWTELPVLSALVMAVNMTVPMVLVMLHHRHVPAAIVEMAAAMVVPTVVGAGLQVVGAIPADLVMTLAHVSMLPAMLLVMLRRYRDYA